MIYFLSLFLSYFLPLLLSLVLFIDQIKPKGKNNLRQSWTDKKDINIRSNWWPNFTLEPPNYIRFPCMFCMHTILHFSESEHSVWWYHASQLLSKMAWRFLAIRQVSHICSKLCIQCNNRKMRAYSWSTLAAKVQKFVKLYVAMGNINY